MARKNSKKIMDINEFSCDYEVEEINFDEVIVGTPVVSFSFNNEVHEEAVQGEADLTTSTSSNKINKNDFRFIEPASKATTPNIINRTDKLTDNRIGKPNPNGITPPIDGEPFDITRTYTFRKSTVRKLNELKASHPDVNAYLSTILDSAINHYYKFIYNNNFPTD